VSAEIPGANIITTTLNVNRYRCRRLASELGEEWQRWAALANPARHGSVRDHYEAINDFLLFCDRAAPDAAQLDSAWLTLDVLDQWEDDMAGRYSARSDVPGKRASQLFRYLRAVEQRTPGRLDPDVTKRLTQPPTSPNSAFNQAVPDFTKAELDRLIVVARRTVRSTERCVAEGRRLAAEGADPRVTASWTWPNLVWLACQQELTVDLVRARMPRLWVDWHESVRALSLPIANGRGRVGEIVTLAYRHVFPHPIDLMGHFALLAIDTGAAPESIKDLTVGDIATVTADRVVEVRLTKHRAHQETTRRFADSGPDTPERDRLKDTGTVLRSLLDVTSATRSATGLPQLFIAGVVHTGWDGVKLGVVRWHNFPLRQWIVDSGLDRPGTTTRHKGSGDVTVEIPAISRPWDLRRFRKSVLAHQAVTHPAEMSLWRDNTVAVFQDHYLVGSTVLMTHVGQLVTRAAGSLADGVRRSAGYTVIAQSAQPALRAGSEEMAATLRIGVQDLVRIAEGQLDVDGRIAACKDAYASPFAGPDELCRAAKLGLCLTCPNAIFTVEHRDGLRRFDEQVIENHRRHLDPVAFAERWLPIRLLVHEVLETLDGSVTESLP